MAHYVIYNALKNSRVATRLKEVGSTIFGRYLFVTNVTSCSGLLALGDVMQQKIERKLGLSSAKENNWNRTGRLAAVGLGLGPLAHIWYTLLDAKLPGRTAKIVVMKILADQIIAAPVFDSSFLLGSSVLEGRTRKETLAEYKEKILTIYVCDWYVWPAAQAFNFAVLPAQYRVLYVNAITLGWDMFLSYIKHHDEIQEFSDADE